MTATRLHWLSATRLGVLRTHLADAFGVWQDGWSVDPQAYDLEPQPLPAVQAVGWKWLRAAGKHGDLCFGARALALDGLATRLAKTTADDALDLGRRVGQRALRDLLAQWSGDPQVALTDVDTPLTGPWRADRGTAAFRLGADAFEARLLVSSELAAHWAPATPRTGPALSSRQAVLGVEPLRLEVVLDLGDTPLSEAQGLQVGDVLVSRTPLDRPFQLHVPGARRIADARLHSRAGHRALLIDTPHASS